ncbi:MAG: hypothetical protein HUK40_17495 [Desulfobacter sp.]|nr:hypothetical protein [Desulfobacter sp.]
MKTRLKFFEATAIITGYGIGGGVMTIPYLCSKAGWLSLLIYLPLGFGISALMHLLVADMMIRDGEARQLIEVIRKSLGQGRLAFLSWLFLGGTFFAFLTSLSAYIAGGGQILVQLMPIPGWAANLVFYLAAAGVVAFGLKAIGLSEKFAIAGIGLFVLVFAMGALFKPFSLPAPLAGGVTDHLALFGMIMFCFFAIFSVPQVVEGLGHCPELIPRAILTGIGINGGIVLVLTFLTLGLGSEINEVAIITLGKALGNWAHILGSLFIILAMLTSYWAISLALADIIQEQFKWQFLVCWSLATVPGFAIVYLGTDSFLRLMELAGGAIGLVIGFGIVPVYRAVLKAHPQPGKGVNLNFITHPLSQIIIAAGFLLMALGALL